VKFLGSGLNEAKFAIKGRQLGTLAEDGNINGFTALATKMILGCFNEQASQACSLVRGVYGELPEVAAGAANFGIYRAEKACGAVFGEENITFAHHGGKTNFVGARAFKEGFDGEGGVDQRNQAGTVDCGRCTEAQPG
jgi:hypothetical protein